MTDKQKSRTNNDIKDDIIEDGVLNFKQDEKGMSKTAKTKEKSGLEKPGFISQFDLTMNSTKITGLVFGFLCLGAVLAFNLYTIPSVILPMTKVEQDRATIAAEKAKVSASFELLKQQTDKENSEGLQLTGRTVEVQFKDFGNVRFKMRDDISPKTVENFVRLVNRKKYDSTGIHRMVEAPDFNVIQGGRLIDTQRATERVSGMAVETFNGYPVPDEVWSEKPTYQVVTDEAGQSSTTQTGGKLKEDAVYSKVEAETNKVIYPKGTILMAKTDRPDSATSEFFINLTDTKIPGQYTVFGVAEADTLPVLDKIAAEVDPNGEVIPELNGKDAPPNKLIFIERMKLL
jgi:cyclophilin family peptidyl-prolyl cis-trans isomerase